MTKLMIPAAFCILSAAMVTDASGQTGVQSKGSGNDDAVVLTWRGCGVLKHAIMHAASSAYQKKTGVQIRISGGGATLGIDAAGSGGADLGGTCRQCLSSRGEWKNDLKLVVVAWDALAVVTHSSNPVDNLTQAQLRDILTQRRTSWSDFGGVSKHIVVVGRRGTTSGVGYCARQLILGDPEAEFGPRVVRLNSSGPVEELVERQPLAIAITGISSARKRNLKVLSVDGQTPAPENVAAGRYPFFRPLYLAFRPGANPHVDDLVRWLISEEGQAVVESEGTVSLQQGALLTGRFEHFPEAARIVNHEQLQRLLVTATVRTRTPAR